MSSMGDETAKTAGVSTEVQKGRFSQKKPIRSTNTDDRTCVIKEWRAKRKLEFQGIMEDCSPLKERETRLSQVWLNLVFVIPDTKQFA